METRWNVMGGLYTTNASVVASEDRAATKWRSKTERSNLLAELGIAHLNLRAVTRVVALVLIRRSNSFYSTTSPPCNDMQKNEPISHQDESFDKLSLPYLSNPV